jgi:peptide/nickel transport system permease protein
VKRPASSQVILQGAAILLLLSAVAVGAPWLTSEPPDRQHLGHRLEGPSADHPLGRDDLGRDQLSRLVWGARISLTAGFLVVIISGTVGVLLGTISGYAGGRTDAILMAIVDLFLGFPGVLLAIALVAVLGPRLSNLILALCLIGWVGFARLARSQALRLRTIEFAEAARSVGATRRRILARHLLPNLLGPCLVQAALGLGGAILAESGLSFLGLGVPPPTPSWGSMLRGGTQNLLDAPHLALVPGAAIFLAVLGANRRIFSGTG